MHDIVKFSPDTVYLSVKKLHIHRVTHRSQFFLNHNFTALSCNRVREALEAAAERHHHPGASDGGDGGGGAGERTGQRRGPRGDLRALPRLNGL